MWFDLSEIKFYLNQKKYETSTHFFPQMLPIGDQFKVVLNLFISVPIILLQTVLLIIYLNYCLPV